MFTEALESRRLFSVSAGFGGGWLHVEGDAQNDSIFITKNQKGTRLLVYDTGSPGWSLVGSWPSGSVTSIQLEGYGGDDRLIIDDNPDHPVTQSSSVYGGNGNDTIAGGRGNDWLFGGDGIDVVDYSTRTEDLLLALDDASNDGPVGGTERDNIRSSVEHVYGGEGNDTIVGSEWDDLLKGNGGHDRIFAQEGNDWVIGDDGDDLLYGGAGSDVVSGGNGNDFVSGHAGYYDVSDDASDFLFGGEGTDALFGFRGRDYYNSNDDGGDVDYLYVSFGAGPVPIADHVLADASDLIL